MVLKRWIQEAILTAVEEKISPLSEEVAALGQKVASLAVEQPPPQVTSSGVAALTLEGCVAAFSMTKRLARPFSSLLPGLAVAGGGYITYKIYTWYKAERAPIIRRAKVDGLPEGGPESVVQGSEIRRSDVKNQSSVILARRTMEGSQVVYTPVAQALRIRDVLFAPRHAFDDGPAYLLPNVEANLNAGNYIEIQFSGEDTTRVMEVEANDVLAIVLTASELSVLGVAKAKVGQVPVGAKKECVAMARAIGCSSTGRVFNDVSFGVLKYDGSTRRGFSGGVYKEGTAILGMHLAGSPNRGVAAAYLDRLAQTVLRQRDGEDSEDWFYEQMADLTEDALVRAGRLRRNPGDPGEWIYQGNDGYYHYLSNDVVNNVGRRRREEYVDSYEPESVDPNESGSQQSPASATRGSAGNSRANEHHLWTALCLRFSKRELSSLASKKTASEVRAGGFLSPQPRTN